MKKEIEYLKVFGATKKDCNKLIPDRNSVWKHINTIGKPDKSLIKLLKGKDKKKYQYLCLYFVE